MWGIEWTEVLVQLVICWVFYKLGKADGFIQGSNQADKERRDDELG